VPGMEWPLVSIVTPSLNQGRYLPETIESVLSQDYPNLEYVVMDGGSTDDTVEILQDYSRRDARMRFVSEPDRGQSHALNKALRLANGDIAGWLNSDDTYRTGAVSLAVEALREHPDWALVYGNAYYINEFSQVIDRYPVDPCSEGMLFRVNTICQPAAFFRRSAVNRLGGVDENLHFCMDYDLWIRIAQQYPIGHIRNILADARLHPDCKNVKDWLAIGYPEVFRISRKYYGRISDYWLLEYIGNHLDRGGDWIMRELQRFGIDGPSPQVAETNRYDDAWVPPAYRLVVRSDPRNPLYAAVIKGRHRMREFFPETASLALSVRVNGTAVMDNCIRDGSFCLEIPIQDPGADSVIEIASPCFFSPSDYGDSDDMRLLSFVVDEVIPLSRREYDYYLLLKRL